MSTRRTTTPASRGSRVVYLDGRKPPKKQPAPVVYADPADPRSSEFKARRAPTRVVYADPADAGRDLQNRAHGVTNRRRPA